MVEHKHRTVSNRPQILELLGAPGTGKTTLKAELCTDPSVAPVSIYWSLRALPGYLRSALSLAPMTLRQGIEKPFPEKGYRFVIRLQAALGVMARAAKPGVSVLVLDQGPVYTMVRLREAVPDVVRTAPFNRWWRHTVESWAQALDAIVVLDAGDDVLLSRIGSRSKPHALKHESPARARHGLLRERVLQAATVAEIRRRRALPVLRFDTSRDPVDRIAAHTMAEIGRSPTPAVGGVLGGR